MARRKGPGGAVGKGGIGLAPRNQDMTVRVAAEQLLLVPISDLVPYANNARAHSKAQISQLRASLRQFGFVTPVLIDFDNNIIAGHGRVEAAKAEGMTEVPCVLVTNLTEVQRKAYILADNRLSETSAWDEPMLRIELEELKALRFDTRIIGFDAASVEAFPIGQSKALKAEKSVEVRECTRAAPGQGARSEVEGIDGEDELDNIPENFSLRDVVPGDVFLLGRHRIMYGNSTSETDIDRLLNSHAVDLLLTDPPYGVNAVKKGTVGGGGETRFGNVGGDSIVPARKYKQILGDFSVDAAKRAYEKIKTRTKKQIIFGGNYFTEFLPARACWVVWDKNNSGNFADCELAWTSLNSGAKLYKHTWNGMMREGPHEEELRTRVHPTQKPVGLFKQILADFSAENDTVLDLFGGSGSVLIACEKMGRTCYMMELDPFYVSVIIARWETLTGQKAEKWSGGDGNARTETADGCDKSQWPQAPE